MFNNIQDPINNKWYSIDSNKGKSILNKYLKINGGGNNQEQIIYNNNGLTEFLNDTNSNKIVGFFSDFCTYCNNTKPEWNKLSRLLANNSINVKKATIDCTLDTFQLDPITKKYKVNAFPTIRLYKKDNKNMVEFTSERTANNLLTFIKENI
mgnify:CR=1 FL=1